MKKYLTVILFSLLVLGLLNATTAANQNPKVTIKSFTIEGGTMSAVISTNGAAGNVAWEIKSKNTQNSPILLSGNGPLTPGAHDINLQSSFPAAQSGNIYYLIVYTNGKKTDTAKTVAV